MIIGINGYAGSGKDLVGKIIQWLTALESYSYYTPLSFDSFMEEYGDKDRIILYMDQGGPPLTSPFEIKKWAGKLKVIASMLTGIPVKKFEDQEFKKTNLGPEWNYSVALDRDTMLQEHKYWEEVPMTVRDFLQKLGTDGLRDGLHTNTWVNALMADYTEKSNWVVTDTRFPNEAQAIKNAGGIVIRIERPGVGAINAHPSETALKDWSFDEIIVNDAGIPTLIASVEDILRKYNILSEKS